MFADDGRRTVESGRSGRSSPSRLTKAGRGPPGVLPPPGCDPGPTVSAESTGATQVMCLDPVLEPDVHADDRSDLDHCTFVVNGGHVNTPARLQVVGSLDTHSTVGLLALTRGLEGDVDV